ncbi:MAG: helix-turn-helix domain-containing protein [Eggerthellaceae bacterium]|nr:helix-turn-helix domain-containing protein [Eggerthellaceae bacterium]
MGKGEYKHIGIEQRRVIEAGLNERDSLAEIARRIGFEVSGVRREMSIRTFLLLILRK